MTTKTIKAHENEFIHVPKVLGILIVALIGLGWLTLQIWAWDGTMPQPPEPAQEIVWLFWGKVIMTLALANIAVGAYAYWRGALDGFVSGLVVGLAAAVVLGLILGLAAAVFMGLAWGLGWGLILGLAAGFNNSRRR